MAPAAKRTLACVAGVLSFVCVSSVARDAHAFCRLTTCDPRKGEECERNDDGCISTGAGLRWRKLPIAYRFHRDGTEKLDDDDARKVVRRAFAKWANVKCEGARTSLVFEELEDSRAARDAFTIHFRDEKWTHDRSGEESLALTNHRYGDYTGFIEFADIEINTADQKFAVGDEGGIDLETVFTHEIGHYIGIAHSNAPGSIMGERYCQDPTQCGDAVLSDDDAAAVCMLYPPGDSTETLEAPPDQSTGCSVTKPPAGPADVLRSAWLAVAGGAVVAGALRRRAHRRRDKNDS